jgi:hypothetical protein
VAEANVSRPPPPDPRPRTVALIRAGDGPPCRRCSSSGF